MQNEKLLVNLFVILSGVKHGSLGKFVCFYLPFMSDVWQNMSVESMYIVFIVTIIANLAQFSVLIHELLNGFLTA